MFQNNILGNYGEQSISYWEPPAVKFGSLLGSAFQQQCMDHIIRRPTSLFDQLSRLEHNKAILDLQL